ncbi:MAG TPA: hypothetical protein VHR47_05390, partial [Bacillota bacterium]|nr:hypothetical protein [Bacillota bacterium]
MVFTYSYTTVYGDYIKKAHIIIYDSAKKVAATISYSSILGGSADGVAQSIVKSLIKKPNNSDNNNEEDKA